MAMRKWITDDFIWKFFSVIIAVGVWLIIHKIRAEPSAPGLIAVSNTFTNVPVLAVSAGAQASSARVAPDSVSVTVSSSPGVMEVLQASQLHVIINLTGIDSAHDLKRRVYVAPPPGVTLLKVEPSEVTVTIPKNQ
jgi:YbbR domain-containing protein